MSAPPYPDPPMGVYQAQPGYPPDITMNKSQNTPGEMAAPPYPGPPMGVYQAQPGYPPVPPPFYPYPPEQLPTSQLVNQVVVVQPHPTDAPGQMMCPNCHVTVITKTECQSGALTYVLCCILAFFLCWLCCCIPFCVESCQDVRHTCPNCKQLLHIHKRM